MSMQAQVFISGKIIVLDDLCVHASLACVCFCAHQRELKVGVGLGLKNCGLYRARVELGLEFWALRGSEVYADGNFSYNKEDITALISATVAPQHCSFQYKIDTCFGCWSD